MPETVEFVSKRRLRYRYPRYFVALDLREHRCLQPGDALLVALVERPLLDALCADEARARQHAHMLADRRLADAELFSDQHAADPIPDEVAIDLGAKMRPRALQPFQDQKPPIAGERAENGLDVVFKRSHIAN